MKEEWLDNEQLLKEVVKTVTRNYQEEFDVDLLIPELERRLRSSGFFEMPLEFYLRELGTGFDLGYHTGQKRFECYSMDRDVEFFGKTALEAAKAAYEWKNEQK